MKYGYARVSTTDQDLALQIAELEKAGCDLVRSEKVSARNIVDRPELKTLLEFLRPGDELWFTRIDRLARSNLDLANIVEALTQRGIALRSTQQPIDTSTPLGKMVVQMLGVFAEFERSLIRERQMAGIAAAKNRGDYAGRGGRPRKEVDRGEAARLQLEVGASAAARQLGVSRATLYRVVAGVAS